MTDLYTEPPAPRTADERIRDAIVGLAEDLTDQDDYEIPLRALAALCPTVDLLMVGSYFTDVLRWVVFRASGSIDRPTCDYNIRLAINQMTGTR